MGWLKRFHTSDLDIQISVKQTNPYNTSVHISLNIAKECDVKVEMSGVVNCALHVSVNSGARSNVEVTVDRAFNSSVHLRLLIMLPILFYIFQNAQVSSNKMLASKTKERVVPVLLYASTTIESVDHWI